LKDILPYQSPQWQVENNGSCELTIFLATNFFAYCITQKNLGILAYGLETSDKTETLADNFVQWYDNNVILKASFKETRVVILTSKCTFVPNEYFSVTALETLCLPLFILSSNETLKYASLDYQEMHEIFALDSELFYTVKSKFYVDKFHGISRLNYDYAIRTKSDAAFAFFYQDYFHVLVLQNNQMLFSNFFSFTNLDMALYHLVNVYDKLKLSRETFCLKLFGLSKDDELLKFIAMYFSNYELKKEFKPIALQNEVGLQSLFTPVA
jgi:hypothetical protein